MPELPDITVYCETIAERIVGRVVERVRIASPFVLRTVEPGPREVEGKTVVAVRRLGKRVVIEVAGGSHASGDSAGRPSADAHLFVVVHLMISGRFRWEPRGKKIPAKLGLAALDFELGTLVLTEASTKKRASIHVVRGETDLAALDPGGIDPMTCDAREFIDRLRVENRTLKRALTDPRIVSGIGNAYSDEILHRAQLSPYLRTHDASDTTLEKLLLATRIVMDEWIGRLRRDAGAGFPKKVTAFRPEMAVHGKFGEPCPVCATSVQRVVYADNEANYCARCQTGGKLLADRALSRLLRDDWPRSLEELEDHMATRSRPEPGA